MVGWNDLAARKMVANKSWDDEGRGPLEGQPGPPEHQLFAER